ncbi:MAG: transcription antitermination factor NusB [Schleiferiaceae bacterium]
MLTRRHIRIKVMQALYGYFQEGATDQVPYLKSLQESLDKIYQLYLLELSALGQFHASAQTFVENAKKKHLPTQEDLNPNLRFIQNPAMRALRYNRQMLAALERIVLENKKTDVDLSKFSWQNHDDLFQKSYLEFRESDEYHNYMNAPKVSIDDHKKIAKHIYVKYISQNETMHQIYEDLNLHWADDLDAAQMMVVKTLKTMRGDVDEFHPLVKLFKDQDDVEFGRKLFMATANNQADYEKLIAEKAKNWEMDRIAQLDIILLKMGLAEVINFDQIPVKVSLNEYIDLSKEYSTPKSGQFINGVLDKLVNELTEKKQIKKIGKGLM